MKPNIFFVLYILLIVFSLPGCEKYLDAKPDKSLQIPSTLNDLQALLDNSYAMNEQNGVSYDEASSDNYYVPADEWNDLSEESKNAYLWQNYDYSNYPNDWGNIYNIVGVANIVLDNVAPIAVTEANKEEWDNVKGSALFYRSFAFLEGAYIFCKAYDDDSAAENEGLVLRLNADVTRPSTRSSVKDTYAQIIEDLQTAATLLPALSQHVMRPSKCATYALLARVYLSMRKYDSCAQYATLALQIKNQLMDYNTIDLETYQPFTAFNEEVLFQNVIGQINYASIDPYYARVDTTLYNSYSDSDLRKKAFFYASDPGYIFNGSYSPYQLYTGITTDEVYLMRAESNARLNDKEKALQDLNTLLIKRWKSGAFVPVTAGSAAEALNVILTERRKELIFRGLRWMDIKRLNKEGANISLKRVVDGQAYTILPNENRFALPLPADIINLTGMEQNPK